VEFGRSTLLSFTIDIYPSATTSNRISRSIGSQRDRAEGFEERRKHDICARSFALTSYSNCALTLALTGREEKTERRYCRNRTKGHKVTRARSHAHVLENNKETRKEEAEKERERRGGEGEGERRRRGERSSAMQ
jgi:hypothetical protein